MFFIIFCILLVNSKSSIIHTTSDSGPLFFKNNGHAELLFSHVCNEILILTKTKTENTTMVLRRVDELYNGRVAYFDENNEHYLSYVDNLQYGTWVYGDDPGKDTASFFIRGKSFTFTPMDAHQEEFHVFNEKLLRWEENSNISMHCTEEAESFQWAPVYYEKDGQEKQSVFVHLVDIDPAESKHLDFLPFTSQYLSEENEWVEVLYKRNLPFGGIYTFQGCRRCILRNLEFVSNGYRMAFFDSKRELDVYLTTSSRGLITKRDRVVELHNPLRTAWGKIEESFEVGDYGMFYCDTDDYFGKVIEKKSGLLIIRAWPSNRKDLMDQTSTNSFTQPLVLEPSSKVAYKGRRSLNLYSFVNYGKSALPSIEKYIEVNEGLWGLSSCFLYHGANALPDQLVYAAELVCFLKGYKPLAMVQMLSDSDSQLKFPFVRELVQAMILTADFHPEVGMRYQKNVDHENNWETIVFYSECSISHAKALLPEGKAQAHHIYPIPDTKPRNNKEIYMKQLEYSFFNGISLGYPERFIHVYCEDLISASDMEAAKMSITDVEKAITLARDRFDNSALQFMMVKKGACDQFDIEKTEPIKFLFEPLKADCTQHGKTEL